MTIQIHCCICTKPMVMSPGSSSLKDAICSESCHKELNLSSLQQLPLHGFSHPRTIRVAELDPIRSLDSLLEDLEGIPDLRVDRYLIPKEVYPLFASHPPPIGLDFPIATLEEGPKMRRVFGINDVMALLRELRVSSFAVTRKIRKKKL